jgi:NitT/TauT family transport system permease protein
LGDGSKIAVAFYACTLILVVSSYYGVLPTPEKQVRIDTLRIFGANQFQIFRIAVLRDALPNIFAGFRVCLSYSFALVVVTEMLLGANTGLGRMIYDYYLQYRISNMYAVIIILGVFGFAVNQIYLLVEKKYLFWTDR